MSLTIKPGVALPNALAMAVMVTVVHDVFKENGFDCVITAGIDGKHSPGSLHYTELALDFRTRHLNQGDQLRIRDKVAERLGDGFDVVLEKDHMHIERQPKKPINA